MEEEINKLTFNDLPSEIYKLRCEIREIKYLLENQPAISKLRNQPLNVSEAAKLLNLSKPTLYRFVNERRIPFHKMQDSRRLYFFENELIEFIRSDRHPVVTGEVSDLLNI